MPFPVLTVANAAIGLGSSILGGLGQRAAAAEANAIQGAQFKTNRAINEAQYDIGNMQNKIAWFWDQAQVAQLRQVEAQNAVDQADFGSELIENAARNLEINSGALYDRFVTEENLRGTQVQLEYDYNQARAAQDTALRVGQYLRTIRDNGLQQKLSVQQAENNVAELQESLLLQEKRDKMEYNITRLAAIASDAEAKARYSARQGSGATSKRLAMEAGQKMGVAWMRLNQAQQDRSNRMNALNRTLKSELATQLGRAALQTEDQMEAMKYTTGRYKADVALAKNQLDKLTIPSFQLGANQYKRELQSLQLQTDQAIQQGSKDYRQREYMDPRKPIDGMRPAAIPPVPAQGPSIGSIISGGLMSGIQGAMKGYNPETKSFE